MKNSRLFSVVLLVTLTISLLPVPLVNLGNSAESTSTPATMNVIAQLPPPPMQPITVRVAIYDEANLTRPSYATTGLLAHELANLTAVLINAGHLVTNVTTSDILNHKLMTASYDVLIIPDNLPRESIVDLVKEFWLGGGGILSFDSAISYLCYAGMIPHESEGAENNGVYWDYYVGTTTHNVSARHPVTQEYLLNDIVTSESMDYGAFNWPALMATSAAGDVVKLAHIPGSPDYVTLLAYESPFKGGRVVQFPSLGPIAPDMEDMLIDSVEWLCPQPKGRVLFDFTHAPYYGVDSWDDLAFSMPAFYTQFRNSIVNRSYTFDKLYPSPSGNLTIARLDPYDILITAVPATGFNYTSTEVAAVTNWVQNGGSLFVIGERYVWNPTRIGYVNYLLSNMNINITTPTLASGVCTYAAPHPTVEACTQLTLFSAGTLNFTGSAYGIWGPDSANFGIGAKEHGAGRVLVAADLDFLGNNYINTDNNYQYAINVINWLGSYDADILLFADEVGGLDPNDNPYRGPVARALNDLGLDFYLTFTAGYFNMSLVERSWLLVIFDNNNLGWSSYLDSYLDYIQTGGRTVLRSWTMRQAAYAPFFDYLGYAWNGSYTTTAPPAIYLWDSSHDIFNQPNLYAASSLNTTFNSFNTDFVNVDLFSNATAIAGITPSQQVNVSAIILSADGRAISNTMVLSDYNDDTDDSTYSDAIEIWQNEIVYMLRPICTFAPSLPENVTEGTILTVSVDINNLGLTPAFGGSVTLSVPSGLGSLIDPATLPFTILPGGLATLTWHINVTGLGNYTLDFTAVYHGFPDTTYTSGTFSADIEAIPPPPIFPPLILPWWVILIIIAVIVIVLVVLLLYFFVLKKRPSK